MRFHAALEPAFLAARNAVLTRSDAGVSALSCCLWLTQLLAHARQSRLCAKAGLLLALNFIPLFEGPNWQFCRARNRCLTLLKVVTFALLCWVPSSGREHGGMLQRLASVARRSSAEAGPDTGAGLCDSSAAAWEALLWEQCLPGSEPGGGGGQQEAQQMGCQPALAILLSESKLFALLHAGLAFRYSRWQHTAALQTALVAAAMAQTAWNCPCSRIEQIVPPAGRWTVQQVATVLANVGLPAYATAATSGVIGSGGVLLSLAPGVDPCRLLLAWTQLCLGWALPIWISLLSEHQARAQFAAANVAYLLPEEKSWALVASVGSDWVAAVFQLPMFFLIVWHLLLAVSAVAPRAGGGGS